MKAGQTDGICFFDWNGDFTEEYTIMDAAEYQKYIGHMMISNRV